MSSKVSVDVAVAGGGLVGAMLATAIASSPEPQGLSVVVIDPSPPPLGELPQPSLRTSTITPSSQKFLEQYGVWSLLPPNRIASFTNMFVWDHPLRVPNQHTSIQKINAMAGALHFDASMNETSELGFVLDNDTLRHTIFRRLQELQDRSNVQLRIVPSAIRDIQFGSPTSPRSDVHSNEDIDLANNRNADTSSQAPWPVLCLDSGEEINARLLVACDGARSRVRQLASMEWYSSPYGQAAVVATVTLNRPIFTAYQRFLSTGPVAVLPLSSDNPNINLANIVWTTTPSEADALCAADNTLFISELNAAIHDDEELGSSKNVQSAEPTADSLERVDMLWRRVSSTFNMLPSVVASGFRLNANLAPPRFLSVHGSRGQFPLHCGHAPSYVSAAKRTVLVGDSAHNIHPLAGQGVNLGFQDALCLSKTICNAAKTGRDIGGEQGAPLMGYQRGRMSSNLAMMGVLHSLQSIFSVQKPEVFRDLRRVGMSAINLSNPAKKMILRMMR